MTDLHVKLTSRRELPRHLRELGVLVGRSVRETELLSLEETEAVQAQANQLDRQPVMAFEIPFDEKSEPRFRVFLERLAEANPSDVYM